MLKKEIILFIGEWDKLGGVKILEHHPNIILDFDLEQLAWKIFLFFENFYLSDESKEYKRTLFQLPIKEKDKYASVLIDSFHSDENHDDIKPYIIALLLPDYFPIEQIKGFNEELQSLNQKFRKDRTLQLNEYFNKIYAKFNLKQKLQDPEIIINSDYTEQEALQDFKKGLNFFSNKAYKLSYYVIKKSYLKFKKENNIKLLLDSTYFLATILSKLNKFNVALDYFKELESLAKKLKHQKYYENALFMSAFCAYKIKDYERALELFDKLDSFNLEFINLFDMYFLYGTLLRILKNYSKSIEIFNKAIESIDIDGIENTTRKNLAKVYFESGNSYFFYTTDQMLSNSEETIYQNDLKKTIEFYEEANEILLEINDYSNLIISNQIIGNIYENIAKNSKAINFYRKAIKYTKENNDVLSRMQLFDLIINNLMILDRKRQLIKEIDEMLYKIKTYAFLDLSTVARYHSKLGKVYINLGYMKEGLSEFLIALNIYNEFEYPKEESLRLLKNIMEIYSNTQDSNYLEYYKEKYNEYQQKLNKFEKEQTKLHALNIIKDIWIFTIEGKEIFSYAPESSSNPQLLSGFLTALRNFSFEMASEQLNAIKLGFDQYLLYGENNKSYIIVGRASINHSEKTIRNLLQTIFSSFSDNFDSIIKNEEYHKNTFTSFTDILLKL